MKKNLRLTAGALPLFLVVFAACATNRSITVNHQLDRSLASYNSLGVSISAGNEQLKDMTKDFGTIFVNIARKRSAFTKVGMSDEGGDLALKLTVVKFSEGNKAARAFNMGGESEVIVNGTLTERRSGTELTTFVVKGNSRRTSRVSVGGFDTSMGGAFDNLTDRALAAASEQIVAYLKDHR